MMVWTVTDLIEIHNFVYRVSRKTVTLLGGLLASLSAIPTIPPKSGQVLLKHPVASVAIGHYKLNE